MTTIQEAMRKALAQKRAQIIADQGKPKLNIGDPELKDSFTVKYVRCTKCKQMEVFETFTMGGSVPNFCTCKPGTEDLVIFRLEVAKPDEDDGA